MIILHKLFRVNIQNVMKRFLIGILLMITLSGCYTTTYFVECTHKIDEGYSNPKTNNQIIGETSFTDEYLTIMPISIDPIINLNIWNNYTSSIRILWDEAAYIDITGNAYRVIHNGIKFTDKEKAQVASTIPTDAKIEDCIIPVESIKYIGGTWTITPFKSYKFDNLAEAEDAVYILKDNPSLIGCTLLLPIMVDDRKIEYTLHFNGDKYSISSKEEYDKDTTEGLYGMVSAISLVLLFVFAGL